MNTFSGVQMSPSSGSLTTGIHFTGAASPTSVNYAAQVQAVPMHQVQAVPVQVHAVPAPKEKVVYQNKYINREVPVEVDRLVKEEVVVYVDKPYEVEKIVTGKRYLRTHTALSKSGACPRCQRPVYEIRALCRFDCMRVSTNTWPCSS
jgi:hypothetical protein